MLEPWDDCGGHSDTGGGKGLFGRFHREVMLELRFDQTPRVTKTKKQAFQAERR